MHDSLAVAVISSFDTCALPSHTRLASDAFMLNALRRCMKSAHLPCPRCRTPLLHAATAATRQQPTESTPLPQAALAGPSRQHQQLFKSWSACRCGAPAPLAPSRLQHAANRGGIAHSLASQAAQQPVNVSRVGLDGERMLLHRSRFCMPTFSPECYGVGSGMLHLHNRQLLNAQGEFVARKPDATHAVDDDTIAAIVTGARSCAHSMPCSTHARGCSTISLTVGLPATGAQQSAVAVIRLSGPDAVATAQHVFVPSSRRQQPGHLQEPWQPESHRVYHGRAVGPNGAVLDEVGALDTDHAGARTATSGQACHASLPKSVDACDPCTAAAAATSQNPSHCPCLCTIPAHRSVQHLIAIMGSTLDARLVCRTNAKHCWAGAGAGNACGPCMQQQQQRRQPTTGP
jgi:hypothetical protein